AHRLVHVEVLELVVDDEAEGAAGEADHEADREQRLAGERAEELDVGIGEVRQALERLGLARAGEAAREQRHEGGRAGEESTRELRQHLRLDLRVGVAATMAWNAMAPTGREISRVPARGDAP